MAPKSSLRTSLGSSQPQPFQAAITELCKTIDGAKTTFGEIKAEELINKLRDFLREYRHAEKTLDSSIITQVTASLEDGAINICSRLDSASFCAVVEIVIQSEACIDGERTLFLLAESLFNDAKDPEKQLVDKRKNDIGKGCLQHLLRYFLDNGVAPTLRRWAGALCVQLFLDCEDNCSWLELGPAEFRQNIGRLVLEEPDEILRMIYAHLVRTLHQADIPLKDLFPTELSEEVYADFPPFTQEGVGWGGSFQTYLDNLFSKEIIEIPESIGNLYMGSSIAMLPEHTFGVPGHNVYIFVHEEELSFLSPAQSDLFDQVLDISLRSIKRMSIIMDAYSQVATDLALELRKGNSHDVFLDSKRIQLEKIYVTCLPDHVNHFKDELIASCPNLEVIETDKNSIFNPTGSDNRNEAAPQSSVTEEIIGGSQAGRHLIKKLSSKPPQVARLRANFIPETQVEQHNEERGVDAKNELHNSVDAIAPTVQEEDADLAGLAPQPSKAMSEDTPAQNASRLKPTVPARIHKGVKPKAKAPIVPRDLRSKANQGTLKDPAPQNRTHAKPKQTESGDNSQHGLLKQEAKGQQKQSEPVVSAQHGSTTQLKKASGLSSQGKASKRTTRFSQVADDMEDSDVLKKSDLRSKGAPKASVILNNASTPSSRHIPAQPVDPQKGKVRVKERNNLPRERNNQETGQFSDDFITEPDEMDTSSPYTRNKTTAAPITKATAKQSSDKTALTSQKPKQYSLNLVSESTPLASALYDIPVDDGDDHGDQSRPKTKTKPTNTRKSVPKARASTKAVNKNRRHHKKADTKKRQSAPAALDHPVATRNSQRAAAAKAKNQLRGADKSDVEDFDAVKPAAFPKPKTAQKEKSNTGQNAMKTNASSTDEVDNKVMSAIEHEEQISPPPQQDAPHLSLARNDNINHIAADDLYHATPKLASKKLFIRALPKSGDNQNAAGLPSASRQNKMKSAVDFSSKLGNLIVGLGDDQAETEHRNTSVRKHQKDSVELTKRESGKESKIVGTAKKGPYLTGYKSIEGKNQKKSSLVKMWDVSDDSSSLTEQREQSEVSPSAPATVAADQEMASPTWEKTRGDHHKTFKKPEVPARQKKSTDQPEKGETSTLSSLADNIVEKEPDSEVVFSQANDEAHIEASPGTPIDSVRAVLDASEVSRKRKAELDVMTPPKKQVVNVSQNNAREASPLSSLPSSPPVRAKRDPKVPKELRHSTENTPATRRSPRLMNRAMKATEALAQASVDENLAKDPDRKPHLVSFGGKGALNQGVISSTKAREDRASGKRVLDKPQREEVEERKRKREKGGFVDHQGPPKKRQSTSPSGSFVADEHDDSVLPALQDSPAVDTTRTKSTYTRPSTRPPTRPSSQTSRVDQNGSPIASSQEDHFGKLRERLAEDTDGNKSQAPAPASVQSPDPVPQRRLSEVFGPKVVLEDKPKGILSSPRETTTRYVAHEKTGTGLYQEVVTKQVIAPETKIQDPFTEQARKSNDFTQRLMSGSSTGEHAIVSTVTEENVPKKYKPKSKNDEPTLLSYSRGVSKTNRPSSRDTHQVDLRERTGGEVENHHSCDKFVPSDMTTSTSRDSHSSEPSRIPLSERPTANDIWNVAIRPPPHYANLHDAVHRIADEVIIRLADEEQKMGLLVEQYKQEGEKILAKLEQHHMSQRATVTQALDQKKMEMVSIYSEANELILETANDLKENSTSQFEREWRQRQDAIRARISAGRKGTET